VATFYIGQIIPFAGNFAISGMALAQGQLLPISQNTALFSILGTFYGGNGTTNFGLPDLRGRRMIGTGQGLGLANYVVGEVGGVEQTTLTIQNLPSHNHSVTGALNASGAQPHATLVDPAAGAVLGHAVDIAPNGTAAPAIYCPSGTAAPIALGGLNVSAGLTGGSQPFSLLNPYLAVSLEIVLVGVFPSRN
jgi:microcystin-dependent protein